MFASIFLVVLVLIQCFHDIEGLRGTGSFRVLHRKGLSLRAVEVGRANEIPNGERKIIDTPAGAVIVANVDGKFYAVNAKCPHLGLPMKKGPINVVNGVPSITCNFHNSVFSLENGSCSAWCQGALNLPGTAAIGSFMSNFGGSANSPATTYQVRVDNDKLYLDL